MEEQLRRAYTAVVQGDPSSFRACAEGLDVNQTTDSLLAEHEGCCLLALAVTYFSRKAVELDDSRSLSLSASRRQRAAVLRDLLKRQPRLRRPDGLRRPEQCLTLLHLLSLARFTEDERDIMRALVRGALAEGVEIGSQDAKGLSPLDWAVMEDQPLVLKELLGAGVPIRVRDGNRAAALAEQCDRQQCLEMLRSKGFTKGASVLGAAAEPKAAAIQAPTSEESGGSQPEAEHQAQAGDAELAECTADKEQQLANSMVWLGLDGAQASGRDKSPLAVQLTVDATGAQGTPLPGHALPPAPGGPNSPLQALGGLLGRCMATGALDAEAFGCFMFHCKREGAEAQRQSLYILGMVEQYGGLVAVAAQVRKELAHQAARQ